MKAPSAFLLAPLVPADAGDMLKRVASEMHAHPWCWAIGSSTSTRPRARFDMVARGHGDPYKAPRIMRTPPRFRPRGLAGEADDEGATCRRGPDGAHTILEITNLLNGDHHGNEIHCPRHYLRRMCGHNQEGSRHHPRRFQRERGRGDKSCHYRPRREGAARSDRGSARRRRLSRGGQFGPSAETTEG